MKKRNKFFALSLPLLMILNILFSMPVFAATNSDYAEALSKALPRMQQLGIVDNVASVQSNITRGQFAKALVIAEGLSDTAEQAKGTTVFADITPGSDISGFVNTVVNDGYMTGMSDGNFHPEKSINFAQACTMMVRMLGYKDSDVSGMWPYNYMNKAAAIGLTSGIKLGKNDALTIGNAALMFDRMMDTAVKSSDPSSQGKSFAQSQNLFNDCTVLDTTATSDSLSPGEVLTDHGTFNLNDSTEVLNTGETYRLQIINNDITKIYGKVKNTLSVTVSSIVDNNISYYDNAGIKSMTLPSGTNYYYHGVKQNYNSLTGLIKADMSIIFTYNDADSNFVSAVINDAIYSNPQIVSNFDPSSKKIGEFVIDENTPILMNGKCITINDIEDMDVIYAVTDINLKHKYYLVIDNKPEGNVTNIQYTNTNTYSVQIDNINYMFSKYIDYDKITSFAVNDKVSGVLDKDGKVLDLRKIDYKTGPYVDCVILGNSKTSDNLAQNQVLTSLGTFYVLNSVGELQLGAKYEVVIDDNKVVKVKGKDGYQTNYTVQKVVGTTVYYFDKDDIINSIDLPSAANYYYKGVKIDYNSILSAIQPLSTIVLSKMNENDTDYDYCIVFDPIFSKPVINDWKNSAVEDFSKNSYLFIYKDKDILTSKYQIFYKDVLYNVSDISDTNRYIYVTEQRVSGILSKITPNKISPKSIQINGKTYELSEYFDISKISCIHEDLYYTLILDINGKVLDIY